MELLNARVLIVDDDRITVQVLTAMLDRAGYQNVWSTSEAGDALGLYRQIRPDLVLLDLHMPQKGGMEVMGQLHEEIPEEEYLPILVITGDVSDEAKLNALLLGAKDFITKPIDTVETMLRIRARLQTRFQILTMAAEIVRLRGIIANRPPAE